MKTVAVVLASFLAIAASPAQDPPVLRYKFKKGESDQVRQVMEMKMAMDVGGQKIETQLKQVMTASEEIAEVDEAGNARLKEVISGLKVEMAAPGGEKLSYDSSKEEDRKSAEDNPQLKIYNSLLNATIAYTLSPLGAVSNLDFTQFGKALEDVPMAAGLRDMMKQTMEQASMPVPKAGVKKGDQWESSHAQTLPNVGEMKWKMTYVYEGMEKVNDRECARIKVTTKLALETAADAPFKATLSSGEAEGVMFFNLDQGRVVQGKNRAKFTMDIEAGGLKANQVCEVSNDFTRTRKP